MTTCTQLTFAFALILGGCRGAAGTAHAHSAPSRSASLTVSSNTNDLPTEITVIDAEHYKKLDFGKFALTVRFHVSPQHVDDFKAVMRARVSAVRQRDTAVDFRLFATQDPCVFVVFESFPSRAVWTTFAKTPETVTFLASIADMQASPYEVQFLDLMD